MFNQIILATVSWIAQYGAEFLLPFMLFVFATGLFLRAVIYFTIRQEFLFSAEFEKRVFKHLSGAERAGDRSGSIRSFHQLVKWLLEKTYHEHFELKAKYKRRRFDHITTVTDRLFLIQAGAHRLVKDALSQTKYLKKADAQAKEPRFLDIAKYVFGTNPVFNKVFGVFPMGTFNDVINLLPGLFVIGGIFGTFLGTMQALPELSKLDITNVESTKMIMDTFLLKMASCMSASIVGIGLSVAMTILNAILAPEAMYVDMVNKFTSSLEFLWNDTENNELDGESTELMDFVDRRGGATPKRRGRKPKGAVAVVPAPTLHLRDAGDDSESDHTADTAVGIPVAAATPPSGSAEAIRNELRKIEDQMSRAELDRATGILTMESYAERIETLAHERVRLETELLRMTGEKAA